VATLPPSGSGSLLSSEAFIWGDPAGVLPLASFNGGHTDPAYPRFDLEIPDQYRYDIWKAEFEHEESSGAVPDLTLIWLPDDHTGGAPDPVAQVADNDLAFGRIVETISHSKVWKDSAIFGVEDDTQNGTDHVDGHRGPAFVISPYAKGGVQDEYETQLNMVRTVEQILGIQPMNQEAAPRVARAVEASLVQLELEHDHSGAEVRLTQWSSPGLEDTVICPRFCGVGMLESGGDR
jgi:hypothetical protein